MLRRIGGMKIGGQVVSTQIQAITRETVASQQGKSTTSVCPLSAPEKRTVLSFVIPR